MCLYPKLIKNKKYLPNNKNKGTPPKPNDKRAIWVAIGCGKCIECMKQKKSNWQVRLHEHIKNNKNGKFTTLTFSEESLERLAQETNSNDANEIATIAMRRFLERWRKKFKKSINHWCIVELGHDSTERMHIHGILFTDESKEIIEEIWKYGHIWIGEYVNGKTVNYIVKYVCKIDKDHVNFQPKILCSPGIGKGYENTFNGIKQKFNKEKTNEQYTLPNGYKTALPIYYRNKIYSEDEREELWMNILDKEERYVMGQKIKTRNSKEIKEFLMAQEHAREKNAMLGYGSSNWKRKSYIASLNLIRKNNKENSEIT